MKKLGFGAMRLPLLDTNDLASFDIPQIEEMADLFISSGFKYFDTAWGYHNGESQSAIKRCVSSRHKRENFFLANKLPVWEIKEESDKQRIFEQQLQLCGVEYFDYYLMHALNVQLYKTVEKFNCFDFGLDLKKQGKIKKLGFSFHDTPQLLETILSKHAHKLDFVQLQINYLDWFNPAVESKKCYEIARKYNLGIVVMEPIKGGTLAVLPVQAEQLIKEYDSSASAASWAIRYAASLDGVVMVLSGMSTLSQLKDNTCYMQDFKPLNSQELEILEKVRTIIQKNPAIPCTGCAYCIKDCPKNIPIPQFFALYNSVMQNPTAGKFNQSIHYNNLGGKSRKASECIECLSCEKLCPQHINISDCLRDVAGLFERKN